MPYRIYSFSLTKITSDLSSSCLHTVQFKNQAAEINVFFYYAVLLFTYIYIYITYLPIGRTKGGRSSNPPKLYLPIISIAIFDNFSCARVLGTAVRLLEEAVEVLVEAVRVLVEEVRVLVEAVRVLVEAALSSPFGDHVLQKFNTLYLTRFKTYKIAGPPQTIAQEGRGPQTPVPLRSILKK